jgi:hypothetical protein
LALRAAANGMLIDLTLPQQICPMARSAEPCGLMNTLVVDYVSSRFLLQNIDWTAGPLRASDGKCSLQTAERVTLPV